MNCHNNIEKESEDLDVLIASFNDDVPIEWVKVHMLPDYAYFDHSVHLEANVGCVSCHGRVDQMDKVMQVEPLSMSWCLDCHRDPDPHIRPEGVSVTNMDWKGPETSEELKEHRIKISKFKEKNKIVPSIDCSACHR